MLSPCSIFDPLLMKDGLFLRDEDDPVPLIYASGALARFLEGWSARLLFTGFAPLQLLELEHRDGTTATWFLREGGIMLGDRIEELSEEMLQAVRHVGAELRNQPAMHKNSRTRSVSFRRGSGSSSRHCSQPPAQSRCSCRRRVRSRSFLLAGSTKASLRKQGSPDLPEDSGKASASFRWAATARIRYISCVIGTRWMAWRMRDS
jgi:hypothetical protein